MIYTGILSTPTVLFHIGGADCRKFIHNNNIACKCENILLFSKFQFYYFKIFIHFILKTVKYMYGFTIDKSKIKEKIHILFGRKKPEDRRA